MHWWQVKGSTCRYYFVWKEYRRPSFFNCVFSIDVTNYSAESRVSSVVCSINCARLCCVCFFFLGPIISPLIIQISFEYGVQRLAHVAAVRGRTGSVLASRQVQGRRIDSRRRWAGKEIVRKSCARLVKWGYTCSLYALCGFVSINVG